MKDRSLIYHLSTISDQPYQLFRRMPCCRSTQRQAAQSSDLTLLWLLSFVPRASHGTCSKHVWFCLTTCVVSFSFSFSLIRSREVGSLLQSSPLLLLHRCVWSLMVTWMPGQSSQGWTLEVADHASPWPRCGV